MNSISRGCLSSLALVLLLIGVAPVHASAQFPAPQPGEVYKEFTVVMSNASNTWRVTDPDAAAIGVPGNSPADFLPNPQVAITISDLQNATRAEVLIDHWGGHVGTSDKAFRFNNNPWIAIPELTNTPTAGQCYMQQLNVILPIPLSHLNQGANTFQGNADRQTCHSFQWGQWGWYQAMVRVFYNPAAKAHPTGSIDSLSNGATFGANPTISASATSGAGVAQVQFLGYYDGPDEDGDGVYLDYHRAYHRDRLDTTMAISGHIGTATNAPYQVAWNTDLVPDQGSIKLLARIQDTNGVWFVTDEVTDLTLQRPDIDVKHYTAQGVPEAYWVNSNRGETLNHVVNIPPSDNLANAISAKLLIATWNGASGGEPVGFTHFTRVNAFTIPEDYGQNYHYSYDVLDVPVASLIQGQNTITLHAEGPEHGVEMLWPGASLVVRYSVPPSTDCGNGQPDAGEQCDDGNNLNGDGCSASCVIEFCSDGIVQTGLGEECDDSNLIDGDGCQADCTRQGFLAFGFEETSGSTVVDLTGSGHNGNLQSGGTRTQNGFFGKAVEFDGSSGNVGLGPIDISGSEATWSMWFKADDFGITDGRLISKATSNDAQDHFWMISTLGEKLRCRVRTTAGGGTTVSVIGPAATLTANVWTHVACVYDGDEIRLYQDGALIKTDAQTGLLAEDNTVGSRIGDQPFGGKTFDGIIDEVRIDQRALSANEIALDMITPLDLCGDGIQQPGEECDDGNLAGGDGCAADCDIEGCGDGILQPSLGEECDDGNLINGDGCQDTCQLPVCGDGVTDAGEECDDGNAAVGDGCTPACVLEFCGDGTVQAAIGEQCDNGLANSDTAPNACRTDCQFAACGDGVVDNGEECDDGNLTDADGCQSTCLLPICGDNVVDAGEFCDDGNITDGDGCSATCQLPFCGDGINDPAEECDDGPGNSDTISGACRTDCTAAACADGIVDPGEQCDDGNTVSGDGCRANCTQEVCGDGIQDLDEECDDGNDVNGDGCGADCTAEICGDGVLQEAAGEECDSGAANSDTQPNACRTTCELPDCGDNVVDAGEQCDDGNKISGDGCQADCRLPACGDNVLDAGEECDDGNVVNGDGCSAVCLLATCGDGILEATEECDNGVLNSDTAPDRCRTDCTNPRCGDQTVDTDEVCDDGNDVAGDGCRPDCTPEICGDGIVDPGEVCDDGNKIGGDGCSSNCALTIELFLAHVAGSNQVTLDWTGGDPDFDVQRGTAPLALTSVASTAGRTYDDIPPDDDMLFYMIVTQCGNGTINAGEECDDGNNVNSDGCQADCTDPFCGDGIVDQLEQCDDGNNINGDGCSALCGLPFCGDNALDPGEECDDGNNIDGDGCSAVCVLPFCGDGVVDGGEECDDGNNVSGDGCQANCVEPFCGDGILDPIEECDDGNNIDGDGCSALCFFPFCGDNVTDPGEECDDGNTISLDGCSESCVTEFCGDSITQPGTGEQCDDGPDNADAIPLACRENCRFAGCGDGVLDQPSELITDGGLENWSGVALVDWLRSTAGGTITETNTEQRSGNSAVQLNRLISGTLRAHQNFGGLEPGSEYELRGWAKVNAGADLADVPLIILQNFSRAEWLQSTGIWDTVQGAGTRRGGLTASGVWQEFAIRFTPSVEFDAADIYKLSLWHGNNFDSGVAVLYDDISIIGPLEQGTFEECDDGNLISGDGCAADCLIEECGNGRLELGEECDDGNLFPGDGCTDACVLEFCGDGVLQLFLGEACDNGAANSDVDPNACRTDCSLPACGDGVLDSGEQCDDGNNGFGDGCSSACAIEFCGDGIHQPGLGEECDQGGANSDATPDACRTNCVLPFCGDSVVDSPEACDDGNNESGDGCSSACQLPGCGDGAVDPGEECDDGNNINGDGCSATCFTVVSDDFNTCVLDARWSFVNPLGDASLRLIGAGTADAQLEIDVPGGIAHDAWITNNSARVMQETDDSQNMQLETKFGSVVNAANHFQGILVEQDSNHWIRFDIFANGSQYRAFAARVINGVPESQINTLIAGGGSPVPLHMRITRAGSNWTFEHSTDRVIWTLAGSFNDTLVVNQVGVLAGNAETVGAAPAHTALFDYFFETSTPISPEDGGTVGVGQTLDLFTVGNGLATADPDQALYFCDAEVTLTATPDPGWIFDNWSGDLEAIDNPATLTMDAAKTVTANFSLSIGPPVISNVAAAPMDTSATITWTTNEQADSRVDYGLTDPPVDDFDTDPALATEHSITLFGLTPETQYFFTVTSVDSDTDSTTSAVFSFTTTAFIPGPFASDDFSACNLAPGWNFVDPLGDSSFSLTGGGTSDAQLNIFVPGGPAHDPFNGNNSARLMQPCQDTDFQVVVKFESAVSLGNQEQGIIVEQDASNWLRFDFVSTGSDYRAFSARALNGSASTRINRLIAAGASPAELYLRVTRIGDDWSMEYGTDGNNWTTALTTTNATFYTQPLNVSTIGVFAGNAGAPAPEHTAVVDYFFEALAPIVPEDSLAAGPGKTLTTTTSGAGSGTVTAVGDQAEYFCDDAVTLTATADGGSVFFEWTGDLSGTVNPQTVTMSADRNVNAVFDLNTGPPIISNILVDVDDVSATITWDTNEAATSRVDYGLAAANEFFEESLTPVTSHSVTLTGLTPDTTYFFTVTSEDLDTLSSSSSVDTFTTNLFPSGAFDSDDFNRCNVNPGRWNFINPLGDASFFTSGAGTGDASVSIVVPGGVSHDPFLSNNAPRLMQAADDADFQLEVKFSSVVSQGNQVQGVIIQQDAGNWLRFDIFSDGADTRAFSARIAGGTPAVQTNELANGATYLRVARDKATDTFTFETSSDGNNWTDHGDVVFDIAVTSVGMFGGNAVSNPAHTAEFDYFFLTSAPIPNEDVGAASDGNLLNLSVVGDGQVDVSPDQASYCSETVTLTATADPSWMFDSWSGDLTGNLNPTPLSMTQSRTVTATFVPPTNCGNGVVDPGEDCDDGNNTAGDGCGPVCVSEVCGNDIVDPGEACDDGNIVGGDGCSPLCDLEFCGDGVVQAGIGEQCDDGGANSDVLADACRTDCQDPTCGDGVQDSGEACDDGNNVNGDACRANCTLPSGGSVLAYPFSDNGSLIIDATGHGNNGNLIPAGVRTTDGYFGDAVSFNGSSGRIEMGNLDIPGPELTLAMWININAFTVSDARLITKAITTATQDHYWMLSTLGPRMRFRVKTDDAEGTTSLFPVTNHLPTNQWVHVAATYNGAEMVIYIDGDVLSSAPKTGNLVQNPGVPAWIGAHTEGGKVFDGRIDEVHILNVALTEAQIEELMLTPADCGNTEIDFGEDCDDGNNVDNDGCDRFCVLEFCGDGLLQTGIGEECDLGAANSDIAVDGCRTNCLVAHCGDGIIDTGEACDDGNTNDLDGCSSACAIESEFCGDGFLQTGLGEECDNGGVGNSDTLPDRCRTDCTLAGCGDGVTDSGEECDDGNLVDGDGCQSTCFNPVCGDGVQDAGEACDDGAANSNLPDANCRTDCSLGRCGDGVLDTGEVCDDGASNSDAPDTNCRTTCTLGGCGDGIVDTIEECDDGAANSESPGAACRIDCTNAGCGDGVLDPGEGCDEGAANSELPDATCRTDCSNAGCGDGVVDTGEDCDEGAGNSDVPDATCRTDCGFSGCGDGVVDTGEACDEGASNSEAPDATCRTDCDNAGCGDGVLDGGEGCDDGNLIDGDGCQANCSLPTCGDGIQDAGEGCDEGAANSELPDATCRTDCQPAGCGDDVVDTGEECDNGAANSDVVVDACRTDCTNPTCGDDVVDTGEGCDDGNLIDGDGCQANCSLPTCGDGILDAGEACDEGAANSELPDATCRTDCQPAGCGDDVVDTGEECDNGAANSDVVVDACRTDCTNPTCGDDVVDTGEGCDDGNLIDGDGCQADCSLPACGDGILDAGEACDEGATNSELPDATCRTDCQPAGCGDDVVDTGETCDEGTANSELPDATCRTDCQSAGCGDDVVDTGEDCDNGAANSDTNPDACRTDCTNPTCGDSVIDAGEGCDDGNLIDGDGCQSDCALPICGDGIVDAGEDCDNGAANSDSNPDACRTDCSDPTCGDDVVDTGEGCDDGNLIDGDGCQADCQLPGCGDGVLDAGEECDEGAANSDAPDATCRTNCMNAGCGDGIVDTGEACDSGAEAAACDDDCTTVVCGDGNLNEAAGEECDDNNLVDGDGCQSTCLLPVCGDNVQDAGEGCDDGNTLDNDGCSATCVVESCGDGIVQTSEECDNGAANSNTNPDACRLDCTNPGCGDGVADTGETCDAGGEAAGCDDDCSAVVCGDSNLNEAAGEQCDDGNTIDLDGCSSTCILESSVCGDGTVEGAEECDEGAGNSDAPDATCRTNCTNAGCGDGIVDTGEDCDDGNTTSGDGCSDTCFAPFVSDDFNQAGLNGRWTFVPAGGSAYVTGPGSADAWLNIAVPGGTPHDAFGTNNAPRVYQDVDDTQNFVLELKLESSVGQSFQSQGIFIEDDANDWLRFDVFSNGTVHRAFAATNINGTGSTALSEDIGTGASPAGLRLRVTRAVDAWTLEYSTNDGATWDEAGTGFTHAMTVRKIGLFAGNAGASPAHIGQFDFIFETGSPVSPEDSSTCGNGSIEAPESCDDGGSNSDVTADACRTNCETAGCGDGVVDTGEVCDDGNPFDGDACPSSCQNPVCGDGIVDLGEECDEGAANSEDPDATCRTDCANAGCGDGVLDNGEECDDNNNVDGDGCQANCLDPVCGDGIIDAGEVCDDGASNSDETADACRTDCVPAGCPDGVVDSGETCDDNNASNGDGCDDTCQIETVCGNGTVELGEDCDEGAGNSDAPDATCRTDCTDQRCGDGITDPVAGEQCDDGNTNSLDGCSATCQTEAEFCGDGIIQAGLGEVCDDGASNSDVTADACRTDCQPAACGDSVIDTGEECDDGNTTSGDGCSASCIALVSDDFQAAGINGRWALTANGGSATITGAGTDDAWLNLVVPGGSAHDAWTGGNNTVHLVQQVDDGDFEIDAKMESSIDGPFQIQGILVEQDANQYIRFDFVSIGASDYKIFAAVLTNDTPSTKINTIIASSPSPTPLYMRVTRTKATDTWEQWYSFDGSSWNSAGTFVEAMTVNNAGVFAGNAGATPPAHTALFDYVFNSAAPISPEDPNSCGDGTIDALEECDNGAGNSDVLADACRTTCRNPGCGDSVIDSGETCDDGNTTPGDGCDASCLIEAVCGDGTPEGTEECDEGAGNSDASDATCRTDCTLAICGDGIVDPARPEACDSGAANSDVTPDACRTDCTNPSCGDNVIDTGETCDDGNTTPGDGCDASCQTEAVCGNGTPEAGEDCDEGAGNSNAPDATCRTDCTNQRCGDTIVDTLAGEECDDGNLIDGDGCQSSCLDPVCGDNILDVGEACDDGNTNNNDGCSDICALEVCGDGIQQTSEECDNGASNSDTLADACRTDCTNAACGDGVTDTVEQCDDGNTNSLDGCSATCQTETEYCGDGVIQAGLGEVCDDGASNSDTVADACRTSCQPAACGDSVVDTGEECDDGNTTSGDGCSATCIGITSDDFHDATADICTDTTDEWTCVNPLGDGTFTVAGQGTANARLSIFVPGTQAHDSWITGNNVARLMQDADDGDFQIQVKFESSVGSAFQEQGLIIESDADTWMRMDFFYNGTTWKAFAAKIDAGVATTYIDEPVTPNNASPIPLYLRVTRTGSTYKFERSIDGTAWIMAGSTFMETMSVSKVGVFAGNAGGSHPAHSAVIDYFFNTDFPISPEDP